MLNIYFGDMPEAVYDVATYFKNSYRDSWINRPDSVQMIRDIDRSEVLSSGLIKSPVLGLIGPLQLSHGVKTLMLIRYDHNYVFNASVCGDNCAPWLLKLASKRKVIVNFYHVMDFGKEPFKIRVLNSGKIVRNMTELIHESIPYL